LIGERIVLHDGERTTDVYVPDSDVYDPFTPQHTFAAVVRDALREGSMAQTPTFADGLACVEVMDRLLAAPRQP
jgi:hypothetical protein